MQIIIW